MVYFSIPLDKMPNVDKTELFDGIRELGFWRRTIMYVLDSNYRKSRDVLEWYLEYIKLGDFVAPKFEGSQASKCAQALSWVRYKMVYTSDVAAWNMLERWQLPNESLLTNTGDCEDGALLLLEVLRQNGIPSNQVYVVAGPVVGGGHAYVVWRSDENLLEYTLDWCYWTNDSLLMPYYDNSKYFNGTKEWFRFNWDGSFTAKIPLV